jgi:hypothetical protein
MRGGKIMRPYIMRSNIPGPYAGQRFLFGAPLLGGLVGGFAGGLVGSTIFRPRPPFYPYGGYPPYGFGGGYGGGYGYGGGFPY